MKKNRKINTDSFLEAFRDLGSNAVDSFKEDFVKGTGRGIVDTFTGKSGSSKNNEESSEKNLFDRETDLEKKYQRQARWQAEIGRKEEHVLFTRQDQETKLQVKSLQNEIQQLVKASGQLSKEVEIAAFQLPAESGKYHILFFERLRNLIKSLRNQVQESSQWLAEFNKKSKRKNSYWNQAKKKGTSFTLSVDRNVSTQTG